MIEIKNLSEVTVAKATISLCLKGKMHEKIPDHHEVEVKVEIHCITLLRDSYSKDATMLSEGEAIALANYVNELRKPRIMKYKDFQEYITSYVPYAY